MPENNYQRLRKEHSRYNTLRRVPPKPTAKPTAAHVSHVKRSGVLVVPRSKPAFGATPTLIPSPSQREATDAKSSHNTRKLSLCLADIHGGSGNESDSDDEAPATSTATASRKRDFYRFYRSDSTRSSNNDAGCDGGCPKSSSNLDCKNDHRCENEYAGAPTVTVKQKRDIDHQYSIDFTLNSDSSSDSIDDDSCPKLCSNRGSNANCNDYDHDSSSDDDFDIGLEDPDAPIPWEPAKKPKPRWAVGDTVALRPPNGRMLSDIATIVKFNDDDTYTMQNYITKGWKKSVPASSILGTYEDVIELDKLGVEPRYVYTHSDGISSDSDGDGDNSSKSEDEENFMDEKEDS